MIIPETWKTGALAALVLAVMSVIGWLAVARANLKAELAGARADYAMCQSANADWATHAATVNAALQKMQDEAQAQQIRAGKAMNKAAKVAKKHADEARVILLEPGRGDDCKAAQNLVRNYLRERK